MRGLHVSKANEILAAQQIVERVLTDAREEGAASFPATAGASRPARARSNGFAEPSPCCSGTELACAPSMSIFTMNGASTPNITHISSIV